MSNDVEISKPGKVALMPTLTFEQFQTLSMEEQLYTVYVSNVAMQNKMIELENQASALADPSKLMDMMTGFMGGGL